MTEQTVPYKISKEEQKELDKKRFIEAYKRADFLNKELEGFVNDPRHNTWKELILGLAIQYRVMAIASQRAREYDKAVELTVKAEAYEEIVNLPEEHKRALKELSKQMDKLRDKGYL